VPLYEYNCADANGNPQHGVLEAAGPQELKLALWAQKLFLISWHLQGSVAPAALSQVSAPNPGPPLTSSRWLVPPVAQIPDRESSIPSRLRSRLRSPKGILLTWVVFLALIVGDYYYFTCLARYNPFGGRPDTLEAHIGEIRPGMKREDVELYLSDRVASRQRSYQSVYRVAPNIFVTIGFDTTGGALGAENCVTSMPEISDAKSLRRRARAPD
jgi:hypothetical protein